MTLNDFLKRVNVVKDGDKVMVFKDRLGGWCNLTGEVGKTEGTLIIYEDTDILFDD